MWPKCIIISLFYICDLNVYTQTQCTLGNAVLTSSSHITELTHLAKNSLRCFYTRSFGSCIAPLKESHLQHSQHSKDVQSQRKTSRQNTLCFQNCTLFKSTILAKKLWCSLPSNRQGKGKKTTIRCSKA